MHKDEANNDIPTQSSLQLELFGSFLANTDAEKKELSNSIDLWDSMPRYSMSRQEQQKIRSERGHLGLLTLDFNYRGAAIKIEIQPALVSERGADGLSRTTSYYPSAPESIIEEVLRKMAATNGHYDPSSNSYGLRFSLYELRAELAAIKHTRSLQEIKLSLEILSGSIIRISGKDLSNRVTERSAYLSRLRSVERLQYEADADSKWFANFHPFVSQSIDRLQLRQFNYTRLMKNSSHLSRWLNKLLIDKYDFASITKQFDILFSTIKRDSMLLESFGRERDAISYCEKCLKELKDTGVLKDFERTVTRGAKNKILDVRYRLFASADFIAEVRASNSRGQAHEKKLSTAARSAAR